MLLYSVSFLRNLFRLKMKGAIQIGAHTGGEIQQLNHAGVKDLLLIEPLNKTFKKLHAHAFLHEQKFNSLLLEKVALGNKTGKVTMHVETANQGMSSSVLEPQKHLEMHPHIEFNKKEEVEMMTLDNLIAKKKLPADRYNTLLIDVQGYELNVLKGATKTLNGVDYIVSEINGTEMYKGGALVEELDDYLALFGFRRVATVWVNRRKKTWGDALYIKNPTFLQQSISGSIFWMLSREKYWRLEKFKKKCRKWYTFYRSVSKKSRRKRKKEQKIIQQWEQQSCPLPPPSIYKYSVLREYARNAKINILVETGTYKGGAVTHLLHDFASIYTIELDDDLYRRAHIYFADMNNVFCFHGDSSIELEKITAGIHQEAIFWLDGHYSGGITAKGKKETPILEELKFILSRKKRDIILIDDVRLFGHEQDYPTLEKLLKFVLSARKAHIENKHDILRIILDN